MGDLGEILGGMFGGGFGGGGRRKRNTRGRDIEIDLTMDFKEAVFGADKKLEMAKLVTCDHCQGNGAEPGSKINACKVCEGQGAVRKMQRTILGNIQTMAACDECHGEGKANEKNCTKCDGQGRRKESVKIDVKIPAGMNNGMSLKMTGQGEAGIKGGKTGDLYIHIHVKPDPDFKREGDDILSQTEISFSHAALGAKIPVKTIDGEVELKIPSATQSGKVFILKGKGVPRFQHYGRGDQLVEVTVKTPDKLNKRQKELLEELGKEGI
jgi:molecular chaperone DnaJ